MTEPALGKTMLRRIEQYRDRWSSYGRTTGIVAISDKLSAAELRRYELFAELDDAFLERLSPDVSVVSWREQAVLFEQGTYLDLAFFVVSGEVEVYLEGGVETTGSLPIFDPTRTSMVPVAAAAPAEHTVLLERQLSESRARAPAEHRITFLSTMDFDLAPGVAARLGAGEILGEIGAMSGWPQSVTARTVTPCELLQIRVPALRLLKRRSPALKKRLDELYRQRALAVQLKSTPLFRQLDEAALERLKERVELVSCEPGEIVAREGEPAAALYLVRSGFVKLSQRFGEDDLVVSYLSKGMTLGEVELLIDGLSCWETTASSVEYAELVAIPSAVAGELLASSPELEEPLWRSAVARLKEAGASRRDVGRAELNQLALDRGLVQGNSMLVIDLDHCTRCDDCVRACAATHGGRPRFVREGEKIDNLLIARSCYHCRDPVCLVGCPTGAIHRAGVGAVVEIDDEICIGCATCANHCPYGAIVMHDVGEAWPADMVPTGLRGQPRRVASKCDLCHESGHDPACVSNCPQGCAYRLGSVAEIQALRREEE
ncbi:MAG: hypothetical protein D6696_16585 [Acidobacteria bacterium]|nr:MAG: hypothetical protein D6696_16585 [Acidobacteriota bacterium]